MYNEAVKIYRAVELKAPGTIERTSVKAPVITGVLAAEAMLPIGGRGQRELIIGDRGIGKTAIVTDINANQHHQNERVEKLKNNYTPMSNNTHVHNNNKMTNQQHPFHFVKSSPWPFLLAFSLCLCLIFTVLWLHEYNTSNCAFLKFLPFGFFFFFFSFISWLWAVVIKARVEKLKNKATQLLSKASYLQLTVFVVVVIGAFLVYIDLWTFEAYARLFQTCLAILGLDHIFHPIFTSLKDKYKHVPHFMPFRDLRLLGQKGKYSDSQLTLYWGVPNFILIHWVVYSTFAFILHNSWYVYFISVGFGYILHLAIFLWNNRFDYWFRYQHSDFNTHMSNMYYLSQFSPYVLNGGFVFGFFIATTLPSQWPVDFSPVERLNDTRDWRLNQKTGPTILSPFKPLEFPLKERRVGVAAWQVLNDSGQKCQDKLVFDAIARVERFETGPNKVAIVASKVVPLQAVANPASLVASKAVPLQAGVTAEQPNSPMGVLNSELHQNGQNFNRLTLDDVNVKKNEGDFKEEKISNQSNRDQNKTPAVSVLTPEELDQVVADAIAAKKTNQPERLVDKAPVIETEGQCELLDDTTAVKLELINILNKFPSTLAVHGRTTFRTFNVLLGFDFPNKEVWDELGGGLRNCSNTLTILKENYQVAKTLNELSLEGEKAYLEMEKEITMLLHNITQVYIVEGTKRGWLRLY